ncbi:hypothetical protein DAI22_02g019600 [Oryza sativa Japonica Group]|nr:hypothetical protein DAI22_02g019600 [Oryza sativa Japonica Group]
MEKKKVRWAEVLGELAPLAISNDRPDVAVEVLLRDAAAVVSPEFNPKRVRVFVDNNFIVVKVPVIS